MLNDLALQLVLQGAHILNEVLRIYDATCLGAWMIIAIFNEESILIDQMYFLFSGKSIIHCAVLGISYSFCITCPGKIPTLYIFKVTVRKTNDAHLICIVCHGARVLILFESLLKFRKLDLEEPYDSHVLIPHSLELLDLVVQILVLLLPVIFIKNHGLSENLLILVLAKLFDLLDGSDVRMSFLPLTVGTLELTACSYLPKLLLIVL